MAATPYNIKPTQIWEKKSFQCSTCLARGNKFAIHRITLYTTVKLVPAIFFPLEHHNSDQLLAPFYSSISENLSVQHLLYILHSRNHTGSLWQFSGSSSSSSLTVFGDSKFHSLILFWSVWLSLQLLLPANADNTRHHRPICQCLSVSVGVWTRRLSDRNTEKVRERLREGKSESVTELIQRVPRANKPSGGDGGRKKRKKKELADKTDTHFAVENTETLAQHTHTHFSGTISTTVIRREKREVSAGELFQVKNKTL